MEASCQPESEPPSVIFQYEARFWAGADQENLVLLCVACSVCVRSGGLELLLYSCPSKSLRSLLQMKASPLDDVASWPRQASTAYSCEQHGYKWRANFSAPFFFCALFFLGALLF